MKSNSQKLSPPADLRELAGVTLKEAAEVAGIAVSTMWAVEHGRTQLNEQQANLIMQFYSLRLRERRRRVIESLRASA